MAQQWPSMRAHATPGGAGRCSSSDAAAPFGFRVRSIVGVKRADVAPHRAATKECMMLQKSYWKSTTASETQRHGVCRLSSSRGRGGNSPHTSGLRACSRGGAKQVPDREAANKEAEILRDLHPSIKSHSKGHLKVSELHTIYYEVFGNPNGQPALFLHGGPGAGCTANHARFFDPKHYRIVLFDQRGCGASTPKGCLEENTTWDLVDDVEKLRAKLCIDSWLVLGGSWGVTLALAYAESYPSSVAGLILRGVCLLRQKEIDWFYKHGANVLFPFGWEIFMSVLEPAEHDDIVGAFYRRLTSSDEKVAEAAASAWLKWEFGLSSFSTSPFVNIWDGKEFITKPSPKVVEGEGSTKEAASYGAPPRGRQHRMHSSRESNGSPAASSTSSRTSASHGAASTSSSYSSSNNPDSPPSDRQGPSTSHATIETETEESGSSSSKEEGPAVGDKGLNPGWRMTGFLAQARLECHYFFHGGFLRENQLLEDVDRIRHIPAIIVQGRYDFVCPLKNAHDLHKCWPEAELRIVPNAGHSMYEQGITHELVCATERFKHLSS